MNVIPEDEAARLEWLERWAAEQWRLTEHQRLVEERRRAHLRGQRITGVPWQQAPRWLANRLLDRGLQTAGRAAEPEHEHPDRLFYQPSAWHVLPRALHYLGVSRRDTFVDFGCGKGRIVHQAARRPFHRVIGVEISPFLAEIARAGLAARRHQHRCERVEIVVSDVTQFRVPDELTIGYFFHPFTGQTFDAMMGNIVASIDRHPRRVRLIYVYPLLGGQVLATGRFRLVKELRGGPRDERLHRAAVFESC